MVEAQTCALIESQITEEDVAVLRCEDYTTDLELAQVSDSSVSGGKASTVSQDAGPREKLAYEQSEFRA